jgi:formyltetrahydrofolate-dependent phosphoribosylglycinamide formyltransferase
LAGKNNKVRLFTDGGSRGNPGPGAAAYVVVGPDGAPLAGRGIYLGKVTNNVAEYSALVAALEGAKQMEASAVEVFSDSELMVKQINGQWRVKNPQLAELYSKCIELLADFSNWSVSHIRREKNTQADGLANRAMDLKKDISLDVPAPAGPPGKKIRIGALISGGGTTVLNIQKEIDAGRLNAEISIVISSRSKVSGLQRAKDAALKVEIVRKKDFDDIEQFSGRIEEVLKNAQVDLVAQAGWLCLWQIPPEYENRVMNIHPALLPSFGGEGMWGHNVHEAVIARGCKVSGCTVHFCTNQYDKGPIILQRGCKVKEGDDADTLAKRVFEQECIAYPEAIRLFSQGRLSVADGVVKIKG